MLVTRRALAAVLGAVSKDKFCNTSVVCIEPDGEVVGTDGHVLVAWKDQAPPADEFPGKVGALTLEPHEPTGRVLLGVGTVKELLKAIPKKAHFLALKCAALVGGAGEKPQVCATDLERVAMFPVETDGNFPNWKRVIPRQDRPITSMMRLRVANLETLVEAYKQAEVEFIELRVRPRECAWQQNGDKWRCQVHGLHGLRPLDHEPEPGASCSDAWSDVVEIVPANPGEASEAQGPYALVTQARG